MIMFLHVFDVPIDAGEGALQIISLGLRQIQRQRPCQCSFVMGVCLEVICDHVRGDNAGQESEGTELRILRVHEFHVCVTGELRDSVSRVARDPEPSVARVDIDDSAHRVGRIWLTLDEARHGVMQALQEDTLRPRLVFS